MYSYKQNLLTIQKMLNVFVKTKSIEPNQLTRMDTVIEQSEKDQFRVLSRPLPLDIQTTMFGAIRNINTAIKAMKEKLRTASLRCENPTTAEQALELMDSLFNVAYYIDPFTNEGKIIADPDEIAKISRILYRKAKFFGFSESQKVQLKEAGITEKQAKSFVKSFDKNVSQELGIEEEVKATVDNNN